jgi:hypothetical protein
MFVFGWGGGETALLPQLRYLDLAGLRIRLHPFDLYERISKLAPALIHLWLPMRMAGGLEGGLALGLGVRVASDQEGVEDSELTGAEEQAAATADTTSDPNAPIELGVPTPFQLPTITSPTQKTSLLPFCDPSTRLHPASTRTNTTPDNQSPTAPYERLPSLPRDPVIHTVRHRG